MIVATVSKPSAKRSFSPIDPAARSEARFVLLLQQHLLENCRRVRKCVDIVHERIMDYARSIKIDAHSAPEVEM